MVANCKERKDRGGYEHLPEQSGLHFQHELIPQHPAASGRRKPRRAERRRGSKKKKGVRGIVRGKSRK